MQFRSVVRAGYLVVITAAVLAPGADALAQGVTFHTREARCGPTSLGTMKIEKETYVTHTANEAAASDQWVGGITIRGTFDATVCMNYRYIQSVKTESDAFRWIKNSTVPLPQPFLDTPPGGYAVRNGAGSPTFNDQPFDMLPYYDEGEFPSFRDRPSIFMLDAKSQADKKLETQFETWLVCVITDMHDNDMEAKDDTYRVAPLVGWQWGFDIVYNDVMNPGMDDFGDFSVQAKPFSFVPNPTADWLKAASAATKYGPAGNQDCWNITIGDCAECPVPEPTSLALLVPGAASLLYRRFWRGRPGAADGSAEDATLTSA